jgi:hypothetical protein
MYFRKMMYFRKTICKANDRDDDPADFSLVYPLAFRNFTILIRSISTRCRRTAPPLPRERRQALIDRFFPVEQMAKENCPTMMKR